MKEKVWVTAGPGSAGGLRPRWLKEYLGQERVKATVGMCIEAARRRGDVLDHVLLYGPPGLGKTTLAGVIANELGVSLRVTSGPAIERPGDLAAILTNLAPGEVLFIDELHRLSRTVEEVLYPAMEDFALNLVLGKGPGARSLRLELPAFTLVGATTRAGLLTSPLRDRFGIICHFDFYSEEELVQIVLRSARILGIEVTLDGAREIARRARGTPRVANRLLKRVRDYTQVQNRCTIDVGVAREALDFLEVDDLGLENTDRRLLKMVIQKFGGGPVGLETLAASIGEETATLEDVVEPYLLQCGLLARTPRGRVATPDAYRHLGLRPPGGQQEALW